MTTLLKKIYKNTFKRIFPSGGDIVNAFLIRELKDCTRIVDLGCGQYSPLGRVKQYLSPDLYSVGVDDFDPYLARSKAQQIHSEYIKSNIFSINFPDKSFDAALLMDVIEHFDHDEFLAFLPKLERIAKKIIILTPNGFVNQDEYDGNEYQIHRSGWTAEDMRNLGFTCYGVSGWKPLRGECAVARIKPLVIGNMICNMTEPLIYHHPKAAYHLMCVKYTS